MATYAVIENQTVVNHAEATQEHAEAMGWVPAGSSKIGDTYLGEGNFETPPVVVPVPQAITMRQARLVLLGAGKLAGVSTAIAAIPDETIREAAEIEWEFSNELQRNNTFVTMLAPALGLTSEQVDQLFIAGSKL